MKFLVVALLIFLGYRLIKPSGPDAVDTTADKEQLPGQEEYTDYEEVE